jgi:hypothetical protein
MNSPIETKIVIGGREILLPNPVMQELKVGNVNLILFKPYKLDIKEFRRNLRAYNEDGVLLWEIQPAHYFGFRDPESWTNIYTKNGIVRIGCTGTDHEDYMLDVNTGHVFHDDGTRLPVMDDLPVPNWWRSK